MALNRGTFIKRLTLLFTCLAIIVGLTPTSALAVLAPAIPQTGDPNADLPIATGIVLGAGVVLLVAGLLIRGRRKDS